MTTTSGLKVVLSKSKIVGSLKFRNIGRLPMLQRLKLPCGRGGPVAVGMERPTSKESAVPARCQRWSQNRPSQNILLFEGGPTVHGTTGTRLS